MLLHTHPQLAFIMTRFQFVTHTHTNTYFKANRETVMRGNHWWNWRHVNEVKDLTFSFNWFLLGFWDYHLAEKPDGVVCFSMLAVMQHVWDVGFVNITSALSCCNIFHIHRRHRSRFQKNNLWSSIFLTTALYCHFSFVFLLQPSVYNMLWDDWCYDQQHINGRRET